jgi:hypothetical protein
MNQIHIVDNFLTQDELKQIKKTFTDANWKYGHTSTNKSIDIPFFIMDLMDNPFYATTLKGKIETHFNINTRLNRVYANGQSFGMNGTYHQDDETPNTVTFCLYVNEFSPELVEAIDGTLLIKIPNDPRIVCVEPYYNRGVLFPSPLFHRGNSFSRFVKDMRICIAWKFALV